MNNVTCFLMFFTMILSWEISSAGDSKIILKHNNGSECRLVYDSFYHKKIYVKTDEMPCYYGGSSALLKYVQSCINIKDSNDTIEVQTSFYIIFIVDEDGNVKCPIIRNKTKNEYSDVEHELIKCISDMPQWKPGRCDGQKVAVRISLPIAL